MSKPESEVNRLLEDPNFFRVAVNYSAKSTTFPSRLIEKDYFCSALLEYLAAVEAALVFRGGTCLAKVYAEFYRLSEDLDFVIPMDADAPRFERSKRAAGVKAGVAALTRQLPAFHVIQPFTGANSSTQYIVVVGYTSLLSGQQDNIKIEVGLREPLLMPVHDGSARTILLDPVSGKPLVKPTSLRCISKTEAFAEKFRAALSRREVAIRDFYDIDYAMRRLGLRQEYVELGGLVRQKLAVPGNESVDVSANRLAALRLQLEPQLKSVLRAEDFAEFDLERAIRTVTEMATKVV